MCGREAMRPAYLRLQRRNTRADELHDPPAFLTHQMVVILPRVYVFVEKMASPQAVAPGQAAAHQEIEISVDGRAGYLRSPIRERAKDLFRVEMPVLREELLEEKLALTSHSHALTGQVVLKQLPFSE